jgi:hypothetical protein
MEHKEDKEEKRSWSWYPSEYSIGLLLGLYNENIQNFFSSVFRPAKDFIKDQSIYQAFAKKVLSEETLKKIGENNKIPISEVLAGIPGKAGDVIRNVCMDNKTCTETVLTNTNLAALAAVGIPLALYLYVQFQGTDEEKEKMDEKIEEGKKLNEEKERTEKESRKERRLTEETSDRRIKRRRENKLKELSETEIDMSKSNAQKSRRRKSEDKTKTKNKNMKKSSPPKKSLRKR